MSVEYLRREDLAQAFGGNTRLIRAFENQTEVLAATETKADEVEGTAQALKDARVVVLSASDSFTNEAVLTPEGGIEVQEDGGLVRLRLNDTVPKVEGGRSVTFLATGNTTLLLPKTGILVTREDVQAAFDGAIYTAAEVASAPAGGLSSTDVQGALNELDTEKQPRDDTLTALAGLAWTAGAQIGVFTAADTVAMRSIGSAAASDILDRAAGDGRYALLAHNHAIDDVTGLQAALDAKLDDTQATAFGLSLLDDADATAGRITLGLGTAAVKNTGTSGDAVPVLNGAATTWAAGASFGGGVSVTGAVAAMTNCRASGHAGLPAGSGPWNEVGIFGGRGFYQAYDYTGAAYLGMDFYCADLKIIVGGSARFEVTSSGPKISGLGNYADDAAAAFGGVPVTGLYRNGSALMIRVV